MEISVYADQNNYNEYWVDTETPLAGDQPLNAINKERRDELIR